VTLTSLVVGGIGGVTAIVQFPLAQPRSVG
jgi:hypothetical protein